MQSSGANHSRLTSMTYPNGFVLTYNYASGLNNSISRLSSLSDTSGTLESYDYLGLGTVVQRSHPQPDIDLTFLGTGPGSGGDQYVGLDSFGRVIDQNWTDGTTSTDRFTYNYDRNGNRLTKGNSVNSDFDEVYTYDGLNQLTSFDRNSGDRTQSWDYDALGNFESVTTDGGSPQTRTHNKQNEITGVSGATTPTFDANGNMTTDETGKQFVYDAWNRLKIVKDSGGTTLKTYTYDALNRRVAEDDGTDTTDLYYSTDWQVLEERINGSGKYRYAWSPVYVDAMVLRDRLDLTERVWVQHDANFNVTAITDSSGAVLERYTYDAYGNVIVMDASWNVLSASAYDWKYLHQGGRMDAVSGLYSFRNRDYSPTLGRWTKPDPIKYQAGDNNLYSYVSNSPSTYLDAYGLQKGVSGHARAITGATIACTLGGTYTTNALRTIGYGWIRKEADAFMKEAADRYPNNQGYTVGLRKWVQNAAHHLYWQMMSTTRFGRSNATMAGNFHEMGDEHTLDSLIDQRHNFIGREVGDVLNKLFMEEVGKCLKKPKLHWYLIDPEMARCDPCATLSECEKEVWDKYGEAFRTVIRKIIFDEIDLAVRNQPSIAIVHPTDPYIPLLPGYSPGMPIGSGR